MKNIIAFFAKRSLSAIIMSLITGLTLVTSAAGVVKVAGSLNSYKEKVPEVKTVEAAVQEEAVLTQRAGDDKKSEKTSPSINTSINDETPTPTSTPTPTPTVKPGLSVNSIVGAHINFDDDKETENEQERPHKENIEIHESLDVK